MKTYIRNCPDCGSVIEYKNETSLKRAKLKNTRCKSCVSSQRKRTKNWSNNISKALKGKIHSKEHNEKSKKTWKERFENGEITIWNNGLDKDSDNRILSSSLKISDTLSGRPLSNEHKQNMSKAQYDRWSNMSTSKRESICNTLKKSAELRKRVWFNTVLSDKYDSYEDWVDSFTDKELYYKAVRNETERQPLHLLENYDKRGRTDLADDVYHVDHIYPIIMGFVNDIPPEVIGNIKNLQMLPYEENIKKGFKINKSN